LSTIVLGTNHQFPPEFAPDSEKGSSDIKVWGSIITLDYDGFALEETVQFVFGHPTGVVLPMYNGMQRRPHSGRNQ
jgi:hypothetical protein